MKLKVGEIAPDFSVPDQNNQLHQLKEYSGKWVLLYIYPKDHTPGCTQEACSLRDNYSQLSKKAVILGVSADSTKSHLGFSQKYHLPFSILAEPEKELIKAYGADGIIFAKRVSFLINPEGYIAKIYPKVNPDTHAGEVLHDLELLAI